MDYDENKQPVKHGKKRLGSLLIVLLATIVGIYIGEYQATKSPIDPPPEATNSTVSRVNIASSKQYDTAEKALDALAVKGRAPKTGYSREQFGSGWGESNGCDTRNLILARDLTNVIHDTNGCTVLSGTLADPYTGRNIVFSRGKETSSLVQIDHVVALSDAWQKGAQQLTPALREQLANDGLNLLAVDGAANQQKSDGDAATWLPAHKPIRCEYVARQISVKLKYSLWVTSAEKNAMKNILIHCPLQPLIS